MAKYLSRDGGLMNIITVGGKQRDTMPTRYVTAHVTVASSPHSTCSFHYTMGIKGLTGLLSQHAPKAIKEHDIKTLFGRKVAIDASMSIYQFLIAVRQKDGELLTNDAGETTSHLMGFFYRTIRIVENGIKPAYIFDGKPPELKKGVVSFFRVWWV